MKQDWHPHELGQHWTLSDDEHELLGNKAGPLGSALLRSKPSNLTGGFRNAVRTLPSTSLLTSPVRRECRQSYAEGEWSERTQRYQRAQIRQHCGFRVFRIEAPLL